MSVLDEDMQWRDTRHEDSWFEYTGYFADNDDWYPEYDEDYEDDVSYEEYINNGTLEYDEDDSWPYPDDDDEEEF